MAKRSREGIRDELISWQIDLSERRDDRGYTVSAAEKRRIKGRCDQLNKYIVSDTAKLNAIGKKEPRQSMAAVSNCSAQQTAVDIATLEKQIADDVALMKALNLLLAQMALAMCEAGM